MPSRAPFPTPPRVRRLFSPFPVIFRSTTNSPRTYWSQFDSLWNDHERWRFLSWAGEHPKRYLAGAISVGTVDQALLSALMVSHSHLRATSLLRQFLVVDEVHASDAYMATILREVLRFHLAAGGHAMLLSATLGSRAATALISAGERFAPKPPPLAEADESSVSKRDNGCRETSRLP